jgi:hypothetical protein
MHFFTAVEGDEPLPLEPVDHLRDRRRREAEELGEACRDHVAALVRERVNRLQILFDGRRSGNC